MQIDDPNLTPRERFELLFGERTESRKMANSDSMLWVNLCETYKSRIESKRVSPTYFANLSSVLRRFTESRNLWNSRLRDISQRDLDAFILDRSADAVSSVTVNNDIRVLNSIFAYAGPRLNVRGHRDNLGIWAVPPYASCLDEPEPIPVSIGQEQIDKFVEATSHATSPRPSVCEPRTFWLAVIVLDSITALRREALLLVPRPDDATLIEKKEIVIPVGIMKNKRAERIPLGTRQDVIDLIASLPSVPGEPILPWKKPCGERLSLSHFNRVMKTFQIAAGIDPKDVLKTKHLRSTAATEILTEQFSTNTARKRLGHKSEGVINRHYAARVVTDADRAASDHLASRIMDVIQRHN